MKIVRGLQPDVDSGSLDLYLDSDLDRDGSHEFRMDSCGWLPWVERFVRTCSGSVASTIESAMSPSFFFTRAAFGPEFSIFLP